MSELFLHPPFDAPGIRALVLGPEPPLATRPATLAGFALRADADALRVALVAEPGARVAGVRADPPPAARARLDFALAAMGARPGAGRGRRGLRLRRARRRMPGRASLARRSAGRASPRRWRRSWGTTAAVRRRRWRRLLHGIGIRALARVRGAASATPVALGAGLGAADVAPVAREFSYARYFGMEEHRLRHRRFDGGMSEVIDRAVFTSGDAITVLPFDPRAGTVLLIEQFRSGPWARRDPQPWSLETVAGRCDVTEPPEATARREAREEAGLELGRIERIAAFYPVAGDRGRAHHLLRGRGGPRRRRRPARARGGA